VSDDTVAMDQHPGASLSTHVLDAAAGGPAVGVHVRVVDGAGSEVGAGTTDEWGRIANLARGLETGEHRIAWHTGGSFVTAVEVTVRLGEGHHHVPLLCTGASAVVYLGV
jgi:5-hydroxyisourate hydrolase